MFWAAISSSTAAEREKKWKSVANHIVNVHVHEGNKVFTKCTHDVIERQWLKPDRYIEPKVNQNNVTIYKNRTPNESLKI